MPPIGSPHAGKVDKVNYRLLAVLGHLARVRVQHPVRLDDYSEPQPDLAVVLPREDFYESRHPLPADTLLIVEVSHSTLRFDRDVKVPLYARHQIAEVWVVDLEHNRIHFFRSPQNGVYTDVSFTDKPEVVALTALPGVTVDLSGLFRHNSKLSSTSRAARVPLWSAPVTVAASPSVSVASPAKNSVFSSGAAKVRRAVSL